MTAHQLVPAVQIRHPGGKDGFWRAGCICGYLSGFHGYPGHAEIAADQHIRAKVERAEKQRAEQEDQHG